MNCSICGSVAHKQRNFPNTQNTQYKCMNEDCPEKYFTVASNLIRESANILLFDIETSPLVGYFWRPWKQNIHMEQLIQDWFMLTWSAKWLNDSKVMGEKLTKEEVLSCDDSRIIKKLWNLFDKADIILAHHGKAFDIPKSNQRFIINKLKSPSPYQIIDTRIMAKKIGDFTYNKLDYLAKIFGSEGKLKTDFSLWANCMKGDTKALSYMLEYNKKDVIEMEKVYTILRGYAKGHPNLNMYNVGSVCSVCQSTNLQQKGEYVMNVTKELTYVCGDCGNYSRQGKKMLKNIAR